MDIIGNTHAPGDAPQTHVRLYTSYIGGRWLCSRGGQFGDKKIFFFSRESKKSSSTSDPSGRVCVTRKEEDVPIAGRLTGSENKLVHTVSFLKLLYL
jgi:hypothetical protein